MIMIIILITIVIIIIINIVVISKLPETDKKGIFVSSISF